MATEDEKNSPPPSVDNGVNQQPPPAAAEQTPDPVEQVKDQLAEKLRSGTLEEPIAPSEVKPSATENPPPTEKKTETPPSKAPDAELKANPQGGQKAEDPPKQEEDPDSLYDDPEDASPDDVDPKFTHIRKRIEKTRASLREARKNLAGYDRLRKTAELAGFKGQQFEDWILLGARANTGDPLATQELGRRLKMAAPELFAAAPSAAHAQQEPPKVEVTAEDVERIYKTRFKARVDAYTMDEAAAREAAKDIATDLATARGSTSQPQNRIPSREAHQPPPERQQQPQQQYAPADYVKAKALAYMDQIDAGFAKSLPNWSEVKALADSMVKADVQAGKVLDPMMWPVDWQEKVQAAQRAIVRKQQSANAPQVKVADTTLRPSRTSSTGTTTPGNKGEALDAIAQALRVGNLDNLPT